MKIKTIGVLLIVAVLLFSLPLLVRSENLYEFVSTRYELNVKLNQFSVADKCKKINGAVLTDIFKEALRTRKSVKFNIVEDEQVADLVISGNVKRFLYSEKDPIDILLPVGLVADVLTTQNYARMEFSISVYNPEKGKVVWKKHLKSTINKSRMDPGESVALVMKRAPKVFIRECFTKRKNRR